MRFLVFLLAMLITVPALAEAQDVKQARVRYAFDLAGMSPSRAELIRSLVSNVYYYDTATALLADTPADGVIGYAIDTDVFYFRAGSSWSGAMVISEITGANGGTIDNDTNNAWTLAENSEDLIITFGTNTATLSSSTGATLIFTPAASFSGDVTLNGQVGALVFVGAGSSVVVPDNSAAALIFGAAGALDLLALDTQDGAEEVKVNGDFEYTGNLTDPGAWVEGFGYGAAKGLATLQIDGTAFDGTAGVHNVAHVGNGHRLLYMPIVGQTLDLAMTATGLDIGMDQVDNDGVEVFAGVLGATGRPYIVGVDPAFQFCLDFTIADGNGTDDFHVGFRGAETANATIDSYNDFASLSIVTVADPALVQIETNLAGAGTVTTSTTDTLADATSTEWCVLVSGAGVVTYTIDGSAPTATAAFTFADGTPVIPFVQVIQANVAQTGELNLENWLVSYQ